MYDKQVRRRRVTLFGLVALSLMLLTVYYGESSGGGLHSVQRLSLSILGPIQEGASRVMKPFRDAFGWVGDTVDAKSTRDRLQRQNEGLQQQVTALQQQAADNKQYRSILHINTDDALSGYAPVQSRVTAKPPNLFSSKVTIDKGSSAGVHNGDPVINGQGLVGRVTNVAPGYSQVTLISDPTFGTGVKVLSGTGSAIQGINATAEASVNRPGELDLTLLNPTRLRPGDTVVTEGSTLLNRPSYYPPGVQLGKVTQIDPGNGPLDTKVRVKPFVDVNDVQRVEVLTRGPGSTAQAAVTEAAVP